MTRRDRAFLVDARKRWAGLLEKVEGWKPDTMATAVALWATMNVDRILAIAVPEALAADLEGDKPEDGFAEAWAEFEAAGYRYGEDALENVRFGWKIARGERP